MNLSAYDNAKTKINKSKTWISIKNKLLLTKEVTKRKYYVILKRFNPNTNQNDYFLAFTDTKLEDKSYHKVFIDYAYRVKVNLSSIWEESFLCRQLEDINVNINLIENQEDGEIYELDI